MKLVGVLVVQWVVFCLFSASLFVAPIWLPFSIPPKYLLAANGFLFVINIFCGFYSFKKKKLEYST